MATMPYYPWQEMENYLACTFPDPSCYRDQVNVNQMSAAWIAQLLHTSPAAIYRHRKTGLIRLDTADKYSAVLNTHPSLFWPSWFDDVELDDHEEELACA